MLITIGEKPAAMYHGSRSEGGHGPLGSLGLLLVTTMAVFVVTACLVTSNLNRNLCYLLPPPTHPNQNEEDFPASQNHQLVHIPQPSKKESSPTRTIGKENCNSVELRRQEDESACVADKVDMRLGAALREEKLRLILSTSRVYILEISYQNHTRNNRASLKLQDFRPRNKKAKNVADVAAVSGVVENRSNIINSASQPFPLLSSISSTSSGGRETPGWDLLDNFSSSLSSDSSLVPFIMSNAPAAKVESTCSHFSSDSFSRTNPMFHKKSSLFHCSESELMSGHRVIAISDR